MIFLYILFLAFFKIYITVFALLSDYPTFTSDAKEYLIIAHNLKTHLTFSSDTTPPLRHDVLRMPLYPLILMLLSSKGSIILQHILLALSSYLLIRRGYRREGFLLFFSPTISVFTNQNLTEGLYVPLMTLLLLFPTSKIWGFLWGMLSLLRQSTVLFFPPLMWIISKNPKRFIYHCLLFMIPIILWTLVNYIKSGFPIFSGVFSTSVLVYVVGKFTDISQIADHSKFESLGEWISMVNGFIISEILKHPVETLVIWLKGTLYTIIKPIPRGYLYPFGNAWLFVYLLFYPYILLIYKRLWEEKRLIFPLLVYILCVGAVGDPRLRLPLEVLIIVKDALLNADKDSPL